MKATVQSFAVGLAAAYAFSILSAKFGPFPGIAKGGKV